MRAGADGEEQRPGLQGSAEQALQAGGDHRAGVPPAAGPAENTFQAGEAGDQVLNVRGSHVATQAESRRAVEPGSRAGCAVAEHGDKQWLQAAEEFLALGARAQLHAQQAQHGRGEGLLLALAFLEALFQGVGQGEAALQQEVGEQTGCEGQAQALESTLPGLGTLVCEAVHIFLHLLLKVLLLTLLFHGFPPQAFLGGGAQLAGTLAGSAAGLAGCLVLTGA